MSGQRGYSLVEVLVALAVLMVGLAALARLSVVGVGDTTSAGQRALAGTLAAEAAEAIAISSRGPDDWAAPPGNGRSFPELFAADWALRVANRLPGGHGAVCRDRSPDDGEPGRMACDDRGPFVVKVTWRAPGAAARREVLVLP